jgi:hypothetical protein
MMDDVKALVMMADVVMVLMVEVAIVVAGELCRRSVASWRLLQLLLS